jgi:hypothetical protein
MSFRKPQPKLGRPRLMALSEAIARYHESNSHDDFEQFLEVFWESRVGIITVNVPDGVYGDLTTSAQLEISIALTNAAGYETVLCFADPPAFILKYGPKFNAEMDAPAVLKTALSNPDCGGVLVNCASAEVSVVITRENAEWLLARHPA